MIEQEKLVSMRLKDPKWWAEVQKLSRFSAKTLARLDNFMRLGDFEKCARTSEDLAQLTDEMVQLSGVQK